RSRARQALAAERLYADHGADHVAVDVGVADPQPLMNPSRGSVDARVYAKRQPVADIVDGIDHLLQAGIVVTNDMQDRPKHLAFEHVDAGDLEHPRCKVMTAWPITVRF